MKKISKRAISIKTPPKTKNRFKIGDRVRISRKSIRCGGEVGTVFSLGIDHSCNQPYVFVKFSNLVSDYYEYSCELVENPNDIFMDMLK